MTYRMNATTPARAAKATDPVTAFPAPVKADGVAVALGLVTFLGGTMVPVEIGAWLVGVTVMVL